MRKRSTYKPRQAVPPMLVSRGLVNDELETRERMVIEAFSGGWAGEAHYDELTDMRNVLTIAASHRDDQSTLAICAAMRIPMENIRQRYADTGHMGITGDERSLFRLFVDTYRDFWNRQSTALYIQACDALNRAHRTGIIGSINQLPEHV